MYNPQNPNPDNNGNGSLVTTDPAELLKSQESLAKFGQPVVLKQSPIWAKTVAWSIMGVTAFTIIWASIAKIEQVVPATGQLKPQGQVKEVQAPVNGVVKEVFIKDGDRVIEGQKLVVFDSEAANKELESLKNIRNSLDQENKFYQALMSNGIAGTTLQQEVNRLKLPQEMIFLARSRLELMGENNFLRSQLAGGGVRGGLTGDQQARLAAAQSEIASQVNTRQLEVEQLQKQLNQTKVKLADSQNQLTADQQVLAQIQQRNGLALKQAKDSLSIEENILTNIDPLVREGAVAKLQYERQRQEVTDRAAQLIDQQSSGLIEYDRQRQQVASRQAEIAQLQQEQSRLTLDIAQGRQEYQTTIASYERNLRDRLAETQQGLAEIDSQFNKIIVENKKRISELDSQISQTQVTIRYQEVTAPVSGTVFDLKAGAGFVPKSGQAEPLLKIVPDDNLIAEVFVTNRDIGFVQADQPTDVRIDSFPFSEFGDIKGKVVSVGSDALPPDEINQFYRFPVKVALDQQALEVKGRLDPIELQSGMSISVNIKVREDRTVLSLFTELFSKKVESLKKVR